MNYAILSRNTTRLLTATDSVVTDGCVESYYYYYCYYNYYNYYYYYCYYYYYRERDSLFSITTNI